MLNNEILYLCKNVLQKRKSPSLYYITWKLPNHVIIVKEFGDSHFTLSINKKNEDTIIDLIHENVLPPKRLRKSTQKPIEQDSLSFNVTDQ